ncbi:MAG: murein transglycosylase A [Sulfurisoma sp.]|nr:murein transglycosylase A [Sulfurisoma sp.]
MLRPVLAVCFTLLLSACAAPPQRPDTCPPCPACPVCPAVEPVKPAEKPLQPAAWEDLPGWTEDDVLPALDAFRASCATLERQAAWRPACAALRDAKLGESGMKSSEGVTARAWLEANLVPWQLVNPDGAREGLITGYYEPVVKGSRTKKKPYLHPVFGPPEDLVVVDLTEIYPELKHMRLRGRLEGRKLVPYYSRGEWAEEESRRAGQALLWIDDAIDLFFLQIQGSGQVELADGGRVRINYADQNGHPYRSIGRWLIDQGELKSHEASMQGIKAWARANPKRLPEMLNANPSLVFFREMAVEGSGPQGALGLPLTPRRSIAVDPRHVPLGAPVFLDTTWPNDSKPLRQMMLAQDTGGAIRGVVRADFYWGSGAEAGSLAGKMRQKGRLWVLLPRGHVPDGSK